MQLCVWCKPFVHYLSCAKDFSYFLIIVCETAYISCDFLPTIQCVFFFFGWWYDVVCFCVCASVHKITRQGVRDCACSETQRGIVCACACVHVSISLPDNVYETEYPLRRLQTILAVRVHQTLPVMWTYTLAKHVKMRCTYNLCAWMHTREGYGFTWEYMWKKQCRWTQVKVSAKEWWLQMMRTWERRKRFSFEQQCERHIHSVWSWCVPR